ncbi:hypothetical protein C8Q79DRAFT_765910 [Trametes meyenii]|nr:hypothetical protein C8Q79DRAFT_765910 [Trametes meyenii]
MYLLSTKTAELHYFTGSQEALSIQCSRRGENPRDHVSVKIRNFCIFAERAGYAWVWIDTCCIDQNSSAELSEAINSMFAWYADADICYAYLYDVPDDEDPSVLDSLFRQSRWYERGWTLQELIAPARVVFLTQTWHTLGSKHMLADVVEQITAIQKEVLTHERSLDSVSVAQRMSWASRRITTRIEDRAYSLLGIFGINMPTIYGEGAHAFVRLQEEILRRIPDQSVFAWGLIHPDIKAAREEMENTNTPEHTIHRLRNTHSDVAFEAQTKMQDLLAPSPSDFANSAGYRSVSIIAFAATLGLETRMPDYTLISHGIRLRLPLSCDSIDPQNKWMSWRGRANTQSTHLGLLACENANGDLLVLILRRTKDSRLTWNRHYAVGEFIDGSAEHHYHRGALLRQSLLSEIDRSESGQVKGYSATDSHNVAKQALRSFDYRKFRWEALSIHHQGPPDTIAHIHPDGPIHEVMMPIPHFTFVLPQWNLKRLATHHGLVCEQGDVDEVALTVPCHLTQDQVDHSIFSVISFVDLERRERIELRVGLGKCHCLVTPFSTTHGCPLHKAWVEVVVVPLPSISDTVNASQVPQYQVLPKISGPEQTIPTCPRAHVDFTMVRARHPVIRPTFGDDMRQVEARFEKWEGFEGIRRNPCKSYAIVLTMSGPVYEEAPQNRPQLEAAQMSIAAEDPTPETPLEFEAHTPRVERSVAFCLPHSPRPRDSGDRTRVSAVRTHRSRVGIATGRDTIQDDPSFTSMPPQATRWPFDPSLTLPSSFHSPILASRLVSERYIR